MATDTAFGQVRFFDDFLGDTLEVGPWTAAKTNSATAFIINAQTNGVVRGTVTNNSGDDLSVLYGELNWQADDGGPLIFEARVAPITALTTNLYAGLSDAKATEMPMDIDSGTLTTTASNGVGFYYGGGESAPVWRYGGVKGDTDSAHAAADSKYNPVAATFQTLRVVVSSDGEGSFYINGNILAENVADCVTVTTSLNAFFAISDDGAGGSLDVDYCYVCKGRV